MQQIKWQLFQKRNGRVTATVRIKPHKPKSKTFDTLRDAKKWAQEIEVTLINEKQKIYDHLFLKDVLEEYRDNVSIRKKSVNREISRINFIIKNMGGVSKSMLILNDPIIDIKEG